jgi:hypothetical protein
MTRKKENCCWTSVFVGEAQTTLDDLSVFLRRRTSLSGAADDLHSWQSPRKTLNDIRLKTHTIRPRPPWRGLSITYNASSRVSLIRRLSLALVTIRMLWILDLIRARPEGA